MALYENVATEYEVYMPHGEYETIETNDDNSYEEMNVLPETPLTAPVIPKLEAHLKTRIAATKILAGCFIGLLVGIMLGVAASLFIIGYNEEMKIISEPIPVETPGQAGKPTNAISEVDIATVAQTSRISPEGNLYVDNQATPYVTVSETEDASTAAKTIPEVMAETTPVPPTKVQYSTAHFKYRTTRMKTAPKSSPTNKSPTRMQSTSKSRAVFPCEFEVNGTCFFIYIFGFDSTTFQVAQTKCREHGGRVATTPSPEAYQYIVRELRNKIPYGKRAITAWIGFQVDPLTGAVKTSYHRPYVKWGPREPNIGQVYADHTQVYIYADVNSQQYTGMRNLSPLYKRDGVICQEEN